MTDARDTTESQQAEKLAAVDSKLATARMTAWTSVVVALLSLIGAIVSGYMALTGGNDIARIESDTKTAIQQVNADLKKSEHAISRAEAVATQFERLLGEKAEGQKRLAFLNLWQLYSDQKDRALVVLAALQYGGDEVFDLLLLLESELIEHKGVVRSLTQYEECREASGDAKNDCDLTERAKHLYSKLDPSGALDLLLDEMSEYPLTSPDDANLVSLRGLVSADNALVAQLETFYNENFPSLIGLSYVLYGYGSQDHFRKIIRDPAQIPDEKKAELVEFLSGWPMRDIKNEDWPHIARFLGDFLETIGQEKKWSLMKPLLRTIKKIRFDHIQDTGLAGPISEKVAALVRDDDLLWPIRSEACNTLIKIDPKRLVDVLTGIVVPPDSIIAQEFARILNERQSSLFEVVQARRPQTDDFVVWQNWLKETHHD